MTEVAMPLDTTNKLQAEKMQEDNIITNVEKEKDTIEEHETDSKVFIHTGNIANWTNLKTRKTNDIPANELYQSLSRSLNKWSTNGNASKLQHSHEIHINCSNAEKLDENERGLLKITAKIFLQNQKVESIQEAMDFIMKQLGITYVDSLYIALPPWDETENFADVILPFWEELERLNDAGFAKQISSCDLDQVKLQSLVEMVRTKPEVNQVNLASCCHMPEELVTYAKQVGVVLHTHGDQHIMLPDDTLNQLIKVAQPEITRVYSTNWLVRYAVVVKCRGVIKSKGYIASINGK